MLTKAITQFSDYCSFLIKNNLSGSFNHIHKTIKHLRTKYRHLICFNIVYPENNITKNPCSFLVLIISFIATISLPLSNYTLDEFSLSCSSFPLQFWSTMWHL